MSAQRALLAIRRQVGRFVQACVRFNYQPGRITGCISAHTMWMAYCTWCRRWAGDRLCSRPTFELYLRRWVPGLGQGWWGADLWARRNTQGSLTPLRVLRGHCGLTPPQTKLQYPCGFHPDFVFIAGIAGVFWRGANEWV